LAKASDTRIAAIATKALKEVTYHLDRSSETVIGLGDGTEESHRRMQTALDLLWPYIGEMFAPDAVDDAMHKAGIGPDLPTLRARFDTRIDAILTEATLTKPDSTYAQSGGKTGFRHSEHLGHLLTQMQWLQRAYPGATW
jgi:ring-1,2-phenylacetyl-CoA epoxidase subunit PaaC